MHVAAYYGNVSVVLMLLQNGGSPDVTNMVRTQQFHVVYLLRSVLTMLVIL